MPSSSDSWQNMMEAFHNNILYVVFVCFAMLTLSTLISMDNGVHRLLTLDILSANTSNISSSYISNATLQTIGNRIVYNRSSKPLRRNFTKVVRRINGSAFYNPNNFNAKFNRSSKFNSSLRFSKTQAVRRHQNKTAIYQLLNNNNTVRGYRNLSSRFRNASLFLGSRISRFSQDFVAYLKQPVRLSRRRCPLKGAKTSTLRPNLSKGYCSMEKFSYGQWVPGAHLCGLDDNYTYARTYWGQPKPFPWSQWCWKPHGCTSQPFSKQSFCQALEGRDILFVGDSLLFEMYMALFYQLNESMTYINPRTGTAKLLDQWLPHIKDSGFICKNSASITFLRSDHLRISREDKPCMGCIPRRNNLMWKHLVNDVDILVMNKGHHATRTEVTEEQFQRDTIETVQFLKRNASQVAIFFVTTSTGHINCSRNSTPVTQPLVTTPNYIRYEDMPTNMKNYSWDLFPQHDKVGKDVRRGGRR